LTAAQLEDRSEKVEGLVDVKKAEFAVALFIAIIGLTAVYQSIDLGPGWGEGGPQPGFLPFSMGTIMAAASVFIVLQAVLKADGSTIFEQKEEIIEVVRVGLPMLVAVVLVETVGFYLMVAVYSAGFIIWYGRYRWYMVIPLAMLFAYVLFQILENFFRIFMPKSMFYSDSFPF
jgi:putative tricarboxylic transport membrane protein